MAMIICRTCGARLELPEGAAGGVCRSCGAHFVFPGPLTPGRAEYYNYGTSLRREGKFEQASEVYGRLLQQNPADVEALWGRLLCRYGVIYAGDRNPWEYIPGCHRQVEKRIGEDVDFRTVLQCCSGEARTRFQREAVRIDAIQQRMKGDTARPSEPAAPSPVAKKPGKKKKKGLLLGVAVGTVMLAAAVGIGAFLLSGDSGNGYEEAVAAMEAGNYQEAIAGFEEIREEKDAEQRILECHYRLGEAALEAGDAQLANEEFSAAGDYEDAAQRIGEGYYALGEAALAAGDFAGADEAFRAAGAYSDAASRIGEGYYQDGLSLMKSGKYARAVEAFRSAGDFDDSAALIEECYASMAGDAEEKGDLKKAYDNYRSSGNDAKADEILGEHPWVANPGDTLYFGVYEQNGDTKDGSEPLEWYVLANNGGRLLLMTKYAVAGGYIQRKNTDVTWETSELRKTLNKNFYKNAFTKAERKLILETNVSMERNPTYLTGAGNSTTDYIFLLSEGEVNQYLVGKLPLECLVTNAASADIWTSDTNSSCKWWLRTPGANGRKMMTVDPTGELNYEGSDVDNRQAGIRPALWVDFSEPEE